MPRSPLTRHTRMLTMNQAVQQLQCWPCVYTAESAFAALDLACKGWGLCLGAGSRSILHSAAKANIWQELTALQISAERSDPERLATRTSVAAREASQTASHRSDISSATRCKEQQSVHRNLGKYHPPHSSPMHQMQAIQMTWATTKC